jgi:protoporphyrin/coproporphyrin ferrochelatase
MSAPKTAVLLLNTGSPDAPRAPEVRRYLAEFLADRRVIELPRWKWMPILHGIVLRVRPKKSAERYREVWGSDGSPLIANTRRLSAALERALPGVRVFWAMRYGRPKANEAFETIEKEGIERVLVFPMFAQYAPQTSAACFDAVSLALLKRRTLPSLRIIRDYWREPEYIDALRTHVEHYWAEHGSAPAQGGKLLVSFHGVPAACSAKGDDYEARCRGTAEALAAALGLGRESWEVAFQSRFGRDEWLRPYAVDAVRRMAGEGVPRVDVFCPGFAADCLETLEELGLDLRRTYENAFRPKKAGGCAFHYIPALNDSPEAVGAYAAILRRGLAGWL